MPRFEVTTGLNIRSGPGTKFERLDGYAQGDVIEEAPTEGWCPVELTDGSLGWVSRMFLKPVTEAELEPIEPPAPPPPGTVTGATVVSRAMSQAGDPYIYGFEVDLNDPNPRAFDCSELVQWVCAQLGVKPTMPDGAVYQYQHCKAKGTLISLAQAVKTPGALLFRIDSGGNHVAISMGNGATIEARGAAYGVGVWSSTRTGFTHAGLIPGVAYS